MKNAAQHRERPRIPALALVLLATLGVCGAGSSSAAAAGCENSWTNSDGGSWFDGASWSRGTVPGPGERICIEAPGTYTVSVTAPTASIASVTLGGGSGTATLALTGGCPGSTLLSSVSGLLIGRSGSVTMGGDCAGDVAIEGPVVNQGRIVTLAGGGERRLRGNLINEGTLAIRADTAFGRVGSTLENEGRIELDHTLTVSEHTDVRNESGAILTAGAGELIQSGGKFTVGSGAISGRQAVVVEGGNLIYAGRGQGAIVLRGDSAISGTPHHGRLTFPREGQTLQLQGSCSQPASITAPAFTNRGTIALESACGGGVTLGLGGETLENRGTIEAGATGGEALSIEGRLANDNTVAVSAGATLEVASGYAQSTRGLYVTAVDGPGSFGALETPGGAEIGGVLSVSTAPGAGAVAGQQMAVLRSTALSGTFRRILHARLRAAGLVYEPLYDEEGVTLRLGP